MSAPTRCEITFEDWKDGRLSDDQLAAVLHEELERVTMNLGTAFRRGNLADYFRSYCDAVATRAIAVRAHAFPDDESPEHLAQALAHCKTLSIDLQQRGREAMRDSYRRVLSEADIDLLSVALRAAGLRCGDCGGTTQPAERDNTDGSRVTFIECGCAWTRDVVRIVDPEGARQVVNLWRPSS